VHCKPAAANSRSALLTRNPGKHRELAVEVDVECHWGATVWSMVKILEKNNFAALDFRLGLALVGSVAGILIFAIIVLGLMAGTAAGLTAALSPLTLILPASILARRVGWPWPCAVFVPFMVPVFLYALVNSTWVTLRQGGIRWRDTFYALDALRSGKVR
jgi:hypothetical protein